MPATSLNLRRLQTHDPHFEADFAALSAQALSHDEEVDRCVAGILADVQARRDAAVLEYTHRFDRLHAHSVSELEIPAHALEASFQRLTPKTRDALEAAAIRIRAYHERQKQACGSFDWQHTEPDGTTLGQKVTPLERVGIYVPGGRAAYPSSVLMNALPAKVAGVQDIVMVVPTPDGYQNPLVLAAAFLAGVNRVFTIGGAQAIGALAYGTPTIPAVDKIVGPGNAYVAAAKRRVFGNVGIDLIAGPSEIVVLCDGTTDPHWIAMDLCAQAEHDEHAQAILLSPDSAFIEQVAHALDQLIPELPRKAIIHRALENRGALIAVRNMEEGCAIINRLAPEHVEIAAQSARQWSKTIHHAGAIFIGRYTSESLGDYCAGPNHVLPTARSARFSSPLGVYDFLKRTSVLEVSEQGARILGDIAVELAYGEGLHAHARSAAYRMDNLRPEMFNTNI